LVKNSTVFAFLWKSRLPRALCVALIAAAAGAHNPSTSYVRISLEGSEATVLVSLNWSELPFFPALDDNRDGLLEQAEVDRHRDELADRLRSAIYLGAGYLTPLPSRLVSALVAPSTPHLEVAWRYTLSDDRSDLQVCSRLHELMTPSHTALVKITGHVRIEQAVLDARRSSAHVSAPTRPVVAAGFLFLGIRHIFTGYDHLLFLVGLLLLVPFKPSAPSDRNKFLPMRACGLQPRPQQRIVGTALGGTALDLVKIVTSFTVAHSITLALATLGAVSLAPRFVESAIALSICYIAAENILFSSAARRWIITFFFGLVHGFGFSAVLRELELPRPSLASSLVFFNLGVEAGQVAIVLLMLPLLALLARSAHRRKIVMALSGTILAVGGFWFVQRTF